MNADGCFSDKEELGEQEFRLAAKKASNLESSDQASPTKGSVLISPQKYDPFAISKRANERRN